MEEHELYDTLVPTCNNRESYARRKFRYFVSKNKDLRKKMFEKCDGICPICLKRMVLPTDINQYPFTAVFDHIIPLLQTQDYKDTSNLRLICNNCNKIKSFEDNKIIHSKRNEKFWKRYFNGESNIFIFKDIKYNPTTPYIKNNVENKTDQAGKS